MRVLEITGEPILHGGQERFIYNLVTNISDPDICLDVLTPYEIDNESFCDAVASQNGQVYSLGQEFTPGKSRRGLYGLIKGFLRDRDYEAVHIHSGSISALAYASKAAKDSGVKKVIVHSHCTGIDSLKHRLIRFIYGQIIDKNATDFWACSKEAGEDKYTIQTTNKRLVVISNGIDVNVFARDEEKREMIRRKLGIADDAFVIGHVGRFSFQKNHEFLLKVFAIVKDVIDNATLVLVGDGELRDDIEKEIEDLKLQDSVTLVGNVDDVEAYYQAMDVFAFPSRFEGFGYVVLEAQAAGIPCVISDEIPNDVVVANEVEVLPIDDLGKWKTSILKYYGNKPKDNRDLIRNAGFDINSTVTLVQQLYLS